MQNLRIVDVGVGKLMGLLDGAVEIGADDVAIEIANHEQWRIKQRFAITQELLIGSVQVFLFAFVFQSEEAAFPDIGETALAIAVRFLGHFARICQCEKLFIFNDALLKTKRLASRGISRSRRWMLEQSAEIVKVFLISRGFLAGISRPLSFEFCGGHRRTFSARTSKGLSPAQERSKFRQIVRRWKPVDKPAATTSLGSRPEASRQFFRLEAG